MRTAWSSFNLSTKISFIFTILVFISVPVTVLSTNLIRDSRIKANSIGDPNYPDPYVRWENSPHFQVQVCNGTANKGDSSNCQIAETDGVGQGSPGQPKYTLFQGNGKYYKWFVDVLVRNGSGGVKYVSVAHSNGNFLGACSGGAPICAYDVTWPNLLVYFKARYHGETKPACMGGPSTCQDAVTDNYSPGPTTTAAQFVDLPNGINLDVDVFVVNELIDVIVGVASGTIQPQLSAPSLAYPANNFTVAQTAFNGFRLQWATVPGANFYALWVSTSSDFGGNGFWYKKVGANECGDYCSKGFVDGGWATQNGSSSSLGNPPANIEAGKKYYWTVWACSDPITCPLTGLASTSSFTAEGATANPTTNPTPTPTPNPTQTPTPTSTPANPPTPALNAPVLLTPEPKGSSPAENISSQPSFAWRRVTGAAGYGIAVSDNYDKLFSVTGVWFTRRIDSVCEVDVCRVNWNSDPWSTRGTFPTKPASLAPNTVYYWYVWACSGNDAQDCPLNTRTIGSFRTQGATSGTPTPIPTGGTPTPTPSTPTPQPTQTPTPPSSGTPTPTETSTPPTPYLVTPTPNQNGTPTSDVEKTPVFKWNPTSTATTYVIAVSDNASGLSNLTGYWSSFVGPSDCSGLCSRSWGDSGKWSTVKDIAARNQSLNGGQVYYWSVRACNSAGCTVSNQSSFRVKGDVTESGPKDLAANPVAGSPGVYKFFWTPANSSSVVSYQLLLKKNNGDFLGGNLKGDFWAKTGISCSAASCSTDLLGVWSYTGGNTVSLTSPNPPNPLPVGDWFFVVFACKVNDGCFSSLNNFLLSDIKQFNVAAPSSAKGTIKPPDTGSGPEAFISQETPFFGSCKNGRVDANFSWVPSGATNAKSQYLDLSLFNNDFQNGTFLSSTPPPAVGAKSLTWVGLLPSSQHYWRINSLIGDQWYPSNTASFTTPSCPEVSAASNPTPPTTTNQAPSKSSGFLDGERPGSWLDLSGYIYDITKGGTEMDPRNPSRPLYLTMWAIVSYEGGSLYGDASFPDDPLYVAGDDSRTRKGLCTVGADGEIGPFQFIGSSWKSLAASEPGLDRDSGSGTRSQWLAGGPFNGCWKHQGADPGTGEGLNSYGQANGFPATYGANIDGGAWDPYAQARVARKTLLEASGCSHWIADFSKIYPGECGK